MRRDRFRATVLTQRFELEIFKVLLMARRHLEIHLRLDLRFYAALSHEIGEPVFDLSDSGSILARLRQAVERRIFEYEPLQGENALRQNGGAH